MILKFKCFFNALRSDMHMLREEPRESAPRSPAVERTLDLSGIGWKIIKPERLIA